MLILLPNFNLIRDCLGFVLFNAACLWLFIEKHHCHGNGQQIHFVRGAERAVPSADVCHSCAKGGEGEIRSRRTLKSLEQIRIVSGEKLSVCTHKNTCLVVPNFFVTLVRKQ